MIGVYAYKFIPLYKERIWGGRALERLFGRPLRQDAHVGESWELADLYDGQSLVADGNDAGKSIQELLKEKASALLGKVKLVKDRRFPLLLKFLDANDILSLQVHPDEEAASILSPAAAMKTECWYVLESHDGYILKDIKPGVTADDFRRVLSGKDGEMAVAELVQRVDVKVGDFYYLPAGTVHALGPGVVVAEIQTPSDTTYRVSDWGRGREIHVREALQSIHFVPGQPPPGAGGDVLVAGPNFTVRRRRWAVGEYDLPASGCRAWMVLEGSGRISCKVQSAGITVAPGHTVLLPAELEQPRLLVKQALVLLEITLPEER